MKRCIINFSKGNWFPLGQERLRFSVQNLSNIDVLSFSDENEIGSPSHLEKPYAFKVFAFYKALELGYDIVLWCDSSLYATRDVKPLFEKREKEGSLLCSGDLKCSEWTNDNMLNYFGISRDESASMDHLTASLIGFNFNFQECRDFLSRWKDSIQVFPGNASNENGSESSDSRCKGHRHDQSAASIIANQLSMKIDKDQYIAVDSINSSSFFTQVRGIPGLNCCLGKLPGGCPPNVPRISLQMIGKKYLTDKSSVTHSFNGKSFLDVYESYFKDMRDEKIKLLEIGILNGNSLRTWRDYFLNGTIVGLDIDPNTMVFEDRIYTYQGSQSDENMTKLLKENYQSFDIILDDGSHINDLTLKSFELYFPLLKSGGYYVIEDTHCTYESAHKSWPGMIYNEESVNYDNSRNVFSSFIEKILFMLDHKQGEIFHVNFYSETVIIKKI